MILFLCVLFLCATVLLAYRDLSVPRRGEVVSQSGDSTASSLVFSFSSVLPFCAFVWAIAELVSVAQSSPPVPARTLVRRPSPQ